MNKKLVLLFALTVVTCWVKAAEPHKIVVENAGTLQELLDATTEGNITKLIVKGELNGADIATLRELKTLRELDIKDVELIADDTPYYVYSYRGDGVWFTSYTRYFISKTRRHKRWSDGLSQASSQYSDYYDYNLAGAFQDMPLQKIVLPSSINEFGRMEFAGCTNLKEIEMVKDPVFVGEGACDGCTSLTTIPTLGKVTSMEQKAFMGCTNLTPSTLYKEVSLTLLDSIPAYAFEGCKSIERVALCPTLRYVDEKAFYNSGLKELELPNNYTLFGSAAFAACSKLDDVSVPNGLYKIPYNLVYSCPWYNSNARVEGGVRYVGNVGTEIDDGATQLFFKDTCTGVADNFNGNTNDKEAKDHPWKIFLSSNCKYIGDCAFRDAIIEKINLVNVETISAMAFYQCKQLNDIYITPTVKSIYDEAFRYCGLETINIPATVEKLGEYVFADNSMLINAIYSTNKQGLGIFSNCTALNSVSFSGQMTSTPSSCCKGCTALQTITLPECLDSIGESSFEDCNSLTEVVIPENVKIVMPYAFRNCTSIRKLTLGTQTHRIYNYAFNGLTNLREFIYNAANATYYYLGGLQHGYAISITENLQKLTIGPKVRSIPENIWPTDYTSLKVLDYKPDSLDTKVFRYWSNVVLDTLIVGESVTSMANLDAFEGIKCIDFRATRLRDKTFDHNNHLETLKLANGVELIPNNCFANCKNLKEVIIPATVKFIGNGAFAECTSLEHVELSDNIETIETRAFYNCPIKNHTVFYLPKHLNVLENDAFYGAEVQRLIVGEELMSASSWRSTYPLQEAEYNAVNAKTTNKSGLFAYQSELKKLTIGPKVKNIPEFFCTDCTVLEDVSYPETIDSIGEGAFQGCEALKKAVLPSSMQYLGGWAFENCAAIEIANIPSAIKDVFCATFRGCKSLKKVVLPAQMMTIEFVAFEGCSKLETIIAPLTSFVPYLGKDVFSETTYSKATLLVPPGMAEQFRNAQWWSLFTNIIESEEANDINAIKNVDNNTISTFNLNGIRIAKPTTRGLNIVRYDNGTVKKVIIK